IPAAAEWRWAESPRRAAAAPGLPSSRPTRPASCPPPAARRRKARRGAERARTNRRRGPGRTLRRSCACVAPSIARMGRFGRLLRVRVDPLEHGAVPELAVAGLQHPVALVGEVEEP